MIHLNGNLLCAIDCETTGLDYTKHDMIQVCFLPLGPDLEPSKDYLPFDIKLKPKDPDSIDPNALSISRATMADVLLHGMDQWLAATLFDEWFEKLNLRPGKRISPLAHNWPFDRDFIREWLGPVNFGHCIDGRFRDTMSDALFLNDFCDFNVEVIDFTRVNLTVLARKVGLEVDDTQTHNAFYDCLLTAGVYKRMLRHVK